MLKAGVLGRRIDPPGGLQLVDLPQPLHPGIVDDLLLGDFSLGQSRGRAEGDIAVDGVVAEAFVLEISHGRKAIGGKRTDVRIMPGEGEASMRRDSGVFIAGEG